MSVVTLEKTEEARAEYTGKGLLKDLVDKVAFQYRTYLADSDFQPTDNLVFELAEDIILKFYKNNKILRKCIVRDVERARNSGEKGLEKMADAILQGTIGKFKNRIINF